MAIDAVVYNRWPYLIRHFTKVIIIGLMTTHTSFGKKRLVVALIYVCVMASGAVEGIALYKALT